MILADTSVWIEFFRGKSAASTLAGLLTENRVAMHTWVLAELQLGHLGARRRTILDDLARLPVLSVATLEELAKFVEEEKLFGSGCSLVDLQLLYSTIVEDAHLWTFDRQLAKLAKRYGVAAP